MVLAHAHAYHGGARLVLPYVYANDTMNLQDPESVCVTQDEFRHIQ